MFYKILLSLFAIFLLSNCKNITTENRFEEEPSEVQEFIVEEEPQNEQEFEVVEDATAAKKMNDKVQEEIEEVEVQDRVFFALDRSDLSSDAKSILDTQSEWLKNDRSINIIVEGHCDERGTREYNIALGERRAAAVKNYLISKGVSASRIKIVSYGKERPAFIGSGESIWSKNRRAVTVVK